VRLATHPNETVLGDLLKTVNYVIGSYRGNAENSFERGKGALVDLALVGTGATALGIHFGFARPMDMLQMLLFSALVALMDLPLLADLALLIDTLTSGVFGLISLGIFVAIVKGLGAILSGMDYFFGIRRGD